MRKHLSRASTNIESAAMDHNCTDGGGDELCLLQSPSMSHSMVVREFKRVVQVLEELGTTPLVDTRQITLIDLSFSGSEPEGDVDRVPRCALFQSPEQPTRRELPPVHDAEEWLIPLASPVPIAGAKADTAVTSANRGSALQGVALEGAGTPTGLFGLSPFEETRSDSSKQPSVVQADGKSLRAATADLLFVEKPQAVDEEARAVDSCTSEKGFAVANMETTFAIPAMPSALPTAAAPKKATSDTRAAGDTGTSVCDTVPSIPAEQSNSAAAYLLQDKLPTILHEEAEAVDSCTSEEGLAVANVDTTFAIPSMPAAASTAVVPKESTFDMGAAHTPVTLEQGSVAHEPAVQSDSATPGSSLAAIQEFLDAGVRTTAIDSCASEESLAVANVDATFAVPALLAVPSTAAVPDESTSDTGAADTPAMLEQGVVTHGPAGKSDSIQESPVVQEEAAVVDSCASKEGTDVPNAETTFAIPTLPTAPSTVLPRKAPPSKTAAADTTITLGGPSAILRRPTSRHPLPPRRSMLPPAAGAPAGGVPKRGPATRLSMVHEATAAVRASLKPPARPAATATLSQRAGRLSVPSRSTVACGHQPSVFPATGDTTFGVHKTTATGKRLSTPKSALQPSQQAAAVSKPVTVVPGPKVRPSLGQSVVGASGGAAAVSRRSLQAPAMGAMANGVAKRGPATRLSMVPDAASAARTLLRPPTKPAATGLRKSLTGPLKAPASARQQTLVTDQQAPEPQVQRVPQPKPEAAMASQLPRSRLPLPRTRAPGSGIPRVAVSSRASSSRALTLLRPIVESPEPARLSSTPVRPNAPLCGPPDLTPIRKQ